MQVWGGKNSSALGRLQWGYVFACWRWMCQRGSIFQKTDHQRVFVSDDIGDKRKLFYFSFIYLASCGMWDLVP